MILKLPFCLFILHIFSTSGENAVNAHVTRRERDLSDFVTDQYKEERIFGMDVNTTFSLQDKTENICRGEHVVQVCNEHNVKILCEHNNFKNVKLGRNDNFSFASPIESRTQFWEYAAFRLDANKDTTKKYCYFCWIQVDGQPPQRSEALILSYYQCSKRVERKTISRTRGSSVSLNCWDPKVEINATVEWRYYSATRLPVVRPISSTSAATLKYDINNVTNADVGHYHCWIWFAKPKYLYVRQFDLRILEPPMPPVDLQCSTEDRLTLKWTQVDTPNKVATYKLESWRLGEDSDWAVVVLPGSSSEFTLPANRTQNNNESSSGSVYLFRITAVNDAGESESEVASCYYS